MGRLARIEQFSPDEAAIVHVVNRAVRRCFLMGQDQFTGRNYDHRKKWIERRMEHLTAFFGIDLLCYSILSNHCHLILRSRPDVVKTWDDTQVARRWLMLCPVHKNSDGSPCEPTQWQLNAIRHDEDKLREIRSRLSDISWWMRLMCQTIAQRINREDDATGRVWQDRYRAVSLLDESALLACAAYVDLNPIRATMAQTLEESYFTSVQRRIQALMQESPAPQLDSTELDAEASQDPVAFEQSSPQVDEQVGAHESMHAAEPPTVRATQSSAGTAQPPDRCLAPLHLDELQDALQIQPSSNGYRCSDRGFLNLRTVDYLELLDWTARQIASGKGGSTPEVAPPIFERLGLGMRPDTWCELVRNFGKLFSLVAGHPQVVDSHRSGRRRKRFHLPAAARRLLAAG